MWKLQQPKICVKIHNMTGVGIGNCSLAIIKQKYWAPGSDVSITFMAHWPLRTATGNTDLTVCADWSRDVSRLIQRECCTLTSACFVKQYKFTSLPNTYSAFWTLPKASWAHSVPSQVIFFLQGLKITLATPVQEQQTVRRSDGRTVRRSDGRTVGRSDGRTVRRSDGQTVLRTRTIRQPAELYSYQRKQARDICVCFSPCML